MKVTIDGEAVAGEAAGVADAIEMARSRSGDVGRVVIEVKADGSALPEAMLIEPPADSGGYGSMEFTTADPALLVRETLLQARDALDASDEDQAEALGLIETGKTEDAMEPVGRALGVWASVQGAVDRSRELVGLDPARVHVEIDGRSVGGQACVDRLGDALGALRDAVRVGDWSAIGDVLAEDLPEASEMWRGMLGALASSLSPGTGGDA